MDALLLHDVLEPRMGHTPCGRVHHHAVVDAQRAHDSVRRWLRPGHVGDIMDLGLSIQDMPPHE